MPHLCDGVASRNDLMYCIVWLNKTGKEVKVPSMPLRIRGLAYPTQVSSYYHILEEHRESVNDLGYMYHLQHDIMDSAAKHALVIYFVEKLIDCHLMYFSTLKYSIIEFLSVAK
jgi:hypothetical protein